MAVPWKKTLPTLCTCIDRTILGWTQVKSTKLHTILEFTVMCTGRPLAAAMHGLMVFQNSPPGWDLQVQKRAGSPLSLGWVAVWARGYFLLAHPRAQACLPQGPEWWGDLGMCSHLGISRKQVMRLCCTGLSML